MARWNFEQWHAGQAARDLARNPFPLLIVGIVATLFSASPKSDRDRNPTPAEYVDRAEVCEWRITCEKAMSDLQQAIDLDPKFARSYVVRASWTLRRHGSVQSALQDYRKARSIYQERYEDFEAQEMTRRAISPLERGEAITCLPVNPIKPFDCL